MTDPKLPDMDQDDPLESEAEDGLEDGPDDAGADSPAFGTAPGSLTSLRIRKRAPAPRKSSGAPRRAAAIEGRPPDDPDQGLQAPGPKRRGAPVRRPAMPFPASAGATNEPARRDPAQPRPAAAAPNRPAPDAGSSAIQGERTQPTSLVAYWTQIKGGRHYPKVTDLEHGRITSAWPNSILMRCRPGSKALQPDRVFSSDGGAAGGLSSLRTSGRINLSPMMLQWLLGLAAEVVRTGRAMQDEEEFPSSSRSARYRAVALPFSDDDRSVDHVLCHVAPAN